MLKHQGVDAQHDDGLYHQPEQSTPGVFVAALQIAHDEHAQELAILQGMYEGISELVGETMHSPSLSLMQRFWWSGIKKVSGVLFDNSHHKG